MSPFESVDEVSESQALIVLPPSNREVAGNLRFDPLGGIALTLLDKGGFGDAFEAGERSYATLHGTLLNGMPFTLLDCVATDTHFGAGGVVRLTLRATQLLSGARLLDLGARVFDELRVSLTNLNEWFGVLPIEPIIEPLPDGSTGKLCSIRCGHLPRFGFSPMSGGPALISQQLMGVDTNRVSRGLLTNTFLLSLRPRTLLSIDECRTELFKLQSFLTLLCGTQAFFRSVMLYLNLPEKERESHPVSYLPRFVRPPKLPHIALHEVFLSWPQVAEHLPSLWSSWLMHYAQYQTSVELFTSTELFGSQQLTFQLLAIMQSLETFHRNRYGGEYTATTEYQQILESLTTAIPSHVSPSLRASLASRLQYGNEYSQRKRLTALADSLPTSVREQIHADLKQFLGQAVDTRNYLTHYSKDLEVRAFKDANLFWAVQLLRWFFVATLLTDMGLPEALLSQSLRRVAVLERARRALTCSAQSPASG